MEKCLSDFNHFKKIINESNVDNRTLVISLGEYFNIPENMINSTAELYGGEQYHVRYNDILVIMFWNENTMRFVFPDYFGVYTNDTLKMVWVDSVKG